MTTPTSRRVEARGPEGRRPAEVILGEGVSLGGARLPVIAGPGTGADGIHVALGATSRREPARLTEPRPVLVDASAPGGAAVGGQAPEIARSAAAVVLRAGAEAAEVADVAALGVPVVLRLTPESALDDRLAVLERVRDAIGSEAGLSALVAGAPDCIAELVRRTDVPVLADLGGTAEAAALAVAAGADGLWLAGEATAASVAQAREAAVRLAPLVRQAVPDTLPGCREAIDAVDAVLATLLEYRVALAGQVQQLKAVGGHAGRDPGREAAIVAGMVARAPSLTPAHIERIMSAVITAGLDVAEREHRADPPVWRM